VGERRVGDVVIAVPGRLPTAGRIRLITEEGMADHSWVQEFPGSITVCDPEGIILEMNARAVSAYQDQGGIKLIGTNMLECHPEPARTKTQRLLETRQENVYTIEKGGVKKLIYQAPWFRDGRYAGFVELSLEIPAQMPHFIRDA
jgi:transcriptional regulator with PAS, ATPase and Fis domain